MSQKSPRYRQADANPNFAAIEKEMLEKWRVEKTFNATLDKTAQEANRKDYVFYDGPPFANGLPHYGHLVTGYVKDTIPRYQTMKGNYVERRFGWDCHGLPAEMEAEKQLGVSGRTAILEYGVEKFNKVCCEAVLRYTDEWQWYVERQGRWVSFDDSYKTMDITYMESVMWAFKQLWKKGLIYEGYRVVPYSWAVQTPLSNFETKIDNAYRERLDPALTVAFRINPADNAEASSTKLLAWTTTPWTLPSNMALCVNAEMQYAVMEKDGARLILAESAIERYEQSLEGFSQVDSIKGSSLIGIRYEPLFPYFADKEQEGAFRIVAADFVTAEDGTGVVHIAPGFGEEDMEVAKTEGIPIVVPVDAGGCFTAQVSDYAGKNVILEANAAIIKDLKARKDIVIRHEQYRHDYPHCWRTDQPLIYMAVNSWYVNVSAFRDRMVELNKGIKWVPEHIRDGQFGNWLANARDWNISRNRFWGSPIPVWRSDDPNYPRVDVYGSLDEIERDFGCRPDDLHKPTIDELTRPNPDDPSGKSMMRRVTDVLDCWFESGSMPFAQLHYPFENKERFEQNFPGDFIVEYVAQTRGWFYTLMVMSTALFDRAPFKNCVCHGVVLDENHQKLSKRLKNYPDPVKVFEEHGSDALRWYLMSSPLMAGGDLAMPKDGREIGKAMRQAILKIWNAYSFFALYANIDGIEAKWRSDQTHVLDRYILAKTSQLIEELGEKLDNYDIPGAYAAVPGFIDALNNWYIRSRRASFWSDKKDQDKQDAYDTLYTALTACIRAVAPLMPMIAERIYTALTNEDSVHLTAWPDFTKLPQDHKLVEQMDLARDVCSSVLSLREQHKRRTRLPLREMTIAHPHAEELRQYSQLISEAVNVKNVIITTDASAFGKTNIKVNPKIGAQLGSKMKEVMAAQRSGDWKLEDNGSVSIAGISLAPENFELRIQTKEGIAAEPLDSWRGLVVLDTEIYPDLQAEGWARDFVRFVQDSRKKAGFNVTDHIEIKALIADTVKIALQQHLNYILKETLSRACNFVQDLKDFECNELEGGYKISEDIDGNPLTLEVRRVN